MISKARRIMVVRATSPKVPIWGRPDGPYPVSNSTCPLSGPPPPNRLSSLRASSNGQAFDVIAALRKLVMVRSQGL